MRSLSTFFKISEQSIVKWAESLQKVAVLRGLSKLPFTPPQISYNPQDKANQILSFPLLSYSDGASDESIPLYFISNFSEIYSAIVATLASSSSKIDLRFCSVS